MYYRHSLIKLANVVVGLSILLVIDAAVLLQRTPGLPPGRSLLTEGLRGKHPASSNAFKNNGQAIGAHESVPFVRPKYSLPLKTNLDNKIIATEAMETLTKGPHQYSVLEAQTIGKGAYKPDIVIGVSRERMIIVEKEPAFSAQKDIQFGKAVIEMHKAKLGSEKDLHVIDFDIIPNPVKTAIDDVLNDLLVGLLSEAKHTSMKDNGFNTELDKITPESSKENKRLFNLMLDSEAGQDALSIIANSEVIKARGGVIQKFSLSSKRKNDDWVYGLQVHI